MFTSRAEYRLTLRADNADQRLTPVAQSIGCVSTVRADRFAAKMERLRSACEIAATLNLTPAEARRQRIAVTRDGVRRTAVELLAYPGVSVPRLGGIWPELATIEPDVAEQLEIDARYAGYLERQASDIAAFRRDEALLLPDGLDYDDVGGLSNEVRARLTAARPGTLGQAARLEGVTAGALTALLAHVRRRNETSTRSRA